MQKNSIVGARLGSEYAFARCPEKKMDPSVLKIGLVDIYLSRKKILADRNMPRTNIEDTTNPMCKIC